MKWELLNDAPFLDSILRECMLGCPDFREGRQYGFMIVFGIWGESNKILLKIYKHTWQYLSEEKYDIWVELSAEDAEVFLSEFGFGITAKLTKTAVQPEADTLQPEA